MSQSRIAVHRGGLDPRGIGACSAEHVHGVADGSSVAQDLDHEVGRAIGVDLTDQASASGAESRAQPALIDVRAKDSIDTPC